MRFPGTFEIILIILAILIIFGGKKIPELARTLGKGLKEFRSGVKDVSKDTVFPFIKADTQSWPSSVCTSYAKSNGVAATGRVLISPLGVYINT